MIDLHSKGLVQPLRKGDEVQTAAVSSAIDDEKSLLAGLKVLEDWGLRCRIQKVCNRNWGYFAGDDSDRYQDLYPRKQAPLTAFARGGWGAARLLERPQPWRKGWFLGYSDVSALLLSRLSAGFDGGIHGPMLTSLAEEPIWSQERIHSLLFGKSIPDIYGEGWTNGICKGPLVVSNLSVGSHLLGTNHIPDLRGAIMIFEDIGEEPYRIDRMLTHWRLTGLLKALGGIGFGKFKQCDAPIDVPNHQTFQLKEVLKERSEDLGIPVVGELPIGHCSGNAALPLGRVAELDGFKGKLSLQAS